MSGMECKFKIAVCLRTSLRTPCNSILVCSVSISGFSWDYAFYTSGVFIALAGVFVYITGILQDRDLAKEEKGESAEMC